jgi:aspartate/methionine/tyrosine aminotransferase
MYLHSKVCPPVPPQKALAPRLSSLRPFIITSARAVHYRQELFKSTLPSPWTILSQGGYYAWVRHPFRGVPSETVSRVLAAEFGIVALPSSGFGPISEEKGLELSDEGKECLRFAVANVTDEKIRMLGARLGSIYDDLNRNCSA